MVLRVTSRFPCQHHAFSIRILYPSRIPSLCRFSVMVIPSPNPCHLPDLLPTIHVLCLEYFHRYSLLFRLSPIAPSCYLFFLRISGPLSSNGSRITFSLFYSFVVAALAILPCPLMVCSEILTQPGLRQILLPWNPSQAIFN